MNKYGLHYMIASNDERWIFDFINDFFFKCIMLNDMKMICAECMRILNWLNGNQRMSADSILLLARSRSMRILLRKRSIDAFILHIRNL